MYPSRHSRSCCYKAQRCRVGCHCCCAAPPQSGALPRETKGFFFWGGGGPCWESVGGGCGRAAARSVYSECGGCRCVLCAAACVDGGGGVCVCEGGRCRLRQLMRRHLSLWAGSPATSVKNVAGRRLLATAQRQLWSLPPAGRCMLAWTGLTSPGLGGQRALPLLTPRRR